MSQRLRKWLTAFAAMLTVAALVALASTRDRELSPANNEARAPGETPDSHAKLLVDPH